MSCGGVSCDLMDSATRCVTSAAKQVSGAKEWTTTSSSLTRLACKKKNLGANSHFVFRVRAHLPASGWGQWSEECTCRTHALDDTIKSVRFKAKALLFAGHSIGPAPPLPTTRTPHFAMPQFPPTATAPCRVHQVNVANPDIDNGRLGTKPLVVGGMASLHAPPTVCRPQSAHSAPAHFLAAGLRGCGVAGRAPRLVLIAWAVHDLPLRGITPAHVPPPAFQA